MKGTCGAEGGAGAECEVLDLLFEALPGDVSSSLYEARPGVTRAELYVKFRGECWRVFAERHQHGVTPT